MTGTDILSARLPSAVVGRPRPTRPGRLAASRAFAWRAVRRMWHAPGQLFNVTVAPIMFMLVFTYLFGGALAGSTSDYLQFLVPGILVQTVLYVTTQTGISLTTDLEQGVHDRFRSMAIWRPAPLTGALLGDTVRYAVAAVVVVGLGLLLGFRPAGGVLGVLAAVALLLVFSFCLSWVWNLLGLLLRTPNAVTGLSMTLLFAATFASNIFVDPATMPGWLRTAIDLNPVSHLVTSVRELMAGAPDAGRLAVVLATCAGLLGVFGPLTMWR